MKRKMRSLCRPAEAAEEVDALLAALPGRMRDLMRYRYGLGEQRELLTPGSNGYSVGDHRLAVGVLEHVA